MFANRLRKNAKHLAKWARKNGVTCYRVYDGDMPEYAVAVDLYEAYAHIQEYAPPKSIDPEKSASRLETVINAVQDVLLIPSAKVCVKVRQAQKGTSQYEKLGNTQKVFSISEGNCRFYVNLHDYLDTGLFLDHRSIRRLIQSMSADKRVLNLFGYTGTASVHAAKGLAKHITTVDLSNTYLTWAKENFVLNDLKGDFEFVRADCLVWLAQSSQIFDLIFLDPPSFSNSKKMASNFDVLRDQTKLIEQTMDRLDQQGTLIFSNNRRKFKLDSGLNERYQVTDITRKTMPKDFVRQPPIHQCWQIQHR